MSRDFAARGLALTMPRLDPALAERGVAQPLPLVPYGPVTNRLIYPEQNQSDGSVQGITYRSRHTIIADTPFVQIVWVNRSTPFNNPANDITLKASYDYLPAGGNMNSVAPRAVTFRGVTSFTASPGGFIVSDPIFGPFRKGDLLCPRAYVSVATLGQRWPLGMTANMGYEGYAAGDATQTANASLSFTATGPAFTPVLIAGPALGLKTVAVLGDSIADGSADDLGWGNWGWPARAFDGNCGYLRISAPGERVATAVASYGLNTRAVLAMQAANVVCAYGTNDLGAGDSLAAIQANTIALWQMFALVGRRVFQATVVPRTASGNSWADAAGQTPHASESVRVPFNDWLRDGAPMAAGIAVATGTASASRAGSAGHPLYGVFDLAAPVEVNAANDITLNGGRWKATGVANGATTDGIHPKGANHQLMAGAVDLARLRV